jgi:hypothetical protein
MWFDIERRYSYEEPTGSSRPESPKDSAYIPVQGLSHRGNSEPETHQAKERKSPNPRTSAHYPPILLDVSDRRIDGKRVSDHVEDPQPELDDAPLIGLPGSLQMHGPVGTSEPRIARETYGDNTEGGRRNDKRVHEAEVGDVNLTYL